MFKNAKRWFYTLLKTVIGSFAGGVTTSVGARVAMPNNIVDFADMWKLALVGAASAAIFNLFFFLQKSPLPDENSDTTTFTKPPAP